MNKVRKTVTAVFCDLVDSTRLGETLDPEALHDLLGAYYEEMTSITRREGGRVEKFIGDAVVAVFGVPRAREDDAVRAVRAAVGMRQAMNKLGETAASALGVRLQARIGVNTGEVISRRVPGGDEVVIGDAMNTAARIQTAAPPNGILISSSTFELSANWAIVKSAPAIDAKGKANPITVLELLDVVRGIETSQIGDAAQMVGRSAELSELETWLSQAKSGTATLGVITGPPGIGKSRLAREFLRRVDASHVRIRCHPPDELSRISGAEPLDPGSDLPEILLVEDAHWAERVELMEIVQAVGSGLGTLGLFVGRPELVSRLGDPPGIDVHNMRIGPLDDDGIRDLIRATVGELGHEVSEQIKAAAEGNPLHARELARSASVAAPGTTPERIPKPIKALLAARVDELPINERSLLEHASIIGQAFREDELVALSDSIEDGNSSDVTPLLSRGILVVTARHPDTGHQMLAFESSMIREIVYDSMLKRRKAKQHEQYARLLAATGEDVRPEQIASHLIGAAENQASTGEGRRRQSELAHEAALVLNQTSDGTALQSRVVSNLGFRVANLLGRPSGNDVTVVSTRNLGAGNAASLAVEQIGGPTRDFDLDATRSTTTIGRLEDCDVPLPWDPEVSRTHATIFFNRGWWISDLDSRNGVRVNGETIQKTVRLESGDRIEIGLSRLRFSDHTS